MGTPNGDVVVSTKVKTYYWLPSSALFTFAGRDALDPGSHLHVEVPEIEEGPVEEVPPPPEVREDARVAVRPVEVRLVVGVLQLAVDLKKKKGLRVNIKSKNAVAAMCNLPLTSKYFLTNVNGT